MHGRARCHRIDAMRIDSLLRCAVFALAALAATAQVFAQAPMHIRGDIMRMDFISVTARPLLIKLRDGAALSIQLAYNYETVEVGPVERERLVPGTDVGVAAEPMADGTLRAIEVLVFSNDMKGSDEGHRPWDLTPRSTMTNATIGAIDASADARTLTLRYTGGEQTVVVPNDAPVVATLRSGGHTRLAPGTHVFITATRQRDGTITAGRIYYGAGDYTPPM
jgi:hypothetical protein